MSSSISTKKGTEHIATKKKATFQWPQVIRLAQLHVKATSLAEQETFERKMLVLPTFLVCEISKQKEKSPEAIYFPLEGINSLSKII